VSGSVDGDVLRVEVPSGRGVMAVHVPRGNLLRVVEPCGAAGGETASGTVGSGPPDEAAVVASALAAPIGTPRLSELAAGAGSAAVVISDVTRPCPSERFLPALLDELSAVAPEHITVVCALGGHRPQTGAERRGLVGDAVWRSGVRIVDLDPTLCRPVAVTSRGTPLEVYGPYLDAELRICTGNIEFHYFAGYSGGAKALMPGMCSPAAIQPNHSMMLDQRAKAGILEGNPVREDIDEAGGLVGIDFILNVVLDESKTIVDAVAGHFLEAHREGVRRYAERFDLSVEAPADIVVASTGGHPKDLNLYQAQKTLDNVSGAVRPGGTIILVAACPEGFGQAVFESWMADMTEPGVLVDRIREEFVLGGHKAAAIAGLLQQTEVALVSEFPVEVVERMHMRPFDDADAALGAALERHGPAARVLVIPYGNRVSVAGG